MRHSLCEPARLGVEEQGKVNAGGESVEGADTIAANGKAVKAKEPLTSAVNGSLRVGATGLEPVTPSVSRYPASTLFLAVLPVKTRPFLD